MYKTDIMNPSVIIPSENQKHDWIEKNIKKMIGQVMSEGRRGQPLPLSIAMNGIALKKFIDILKSESAYHPETSGKFTFIGIPVRLNNLLPFGSFVVERFKPVKMV